MSDDSRRVDELLDLSGRTVLVTGAGGNIGQGIARRLAEAGARIIAHYLSSGGAADALAAAIESSGGSCTTIGADLSEPDAIEAMFAELDAGGFELDGLVNNAALQPVRPLAEMTAEDWRAMMAVNLDAAFLMIRLAAGRMGKRGGGAIANIGSIEGSDPAFGHGHYATSKAGLAMLTRAAALEFGGDGIRVNLVCPGLIDRVGLGEDWPEGVERWRSRVPLGRLGDAKDVADAVLFLLSPAARWVSGASLTVDGGMSSVSRW